MPGLLTTQLVGSYSKPNWLIRHQRVTSPSSSFWRPDPEVLAEAGVDVVQLDEPDFHFRRDMAVQWGGRALDLAFAKISSLVQAVRTVRSELGLPAAASSEE